MARLPVPGSDDGVWGDVLNDFLSVEHSSDGTLKKAADIADAKSKADGALQRSANLSDLVDVSAARTNLGLGTAATHATADFDAAGSATTAQNNAKTYTDQQIAGIAAASGVPSLPLFNVEDYGAVGDGVTDDYTAIRAAHDAMLASSVGGLVVFPHIGPYRMDLSVSGRVAATSDGAYAALPLPQIPPDGTHPKRTFGYIGVGEPYAARLWGGNNNTAISQISTVLLADYTTPFSWSNTDGLPSVIGGPDADKGANAGLSSFTNMHFIADRITIRQPQDPSLCGMNLEQVSTAVLGSIGFDVNVPQDLAPEPTHPTGAALLMPKVNNSVAARIDRIFVWGYYTGVPFTEHCDVGSALIVRCKIAAPIRRGGAHFAHATMISAEQCPWGIAGYKPYGAGPNLGVAPVNTDDGGGSPVWKIDFLDFEDFAYGQHGTNGPDAWMYAPSVGAHVYDPNNILQGMCWAGRNDSETGGAGITSQLWVAGAGGFSIFSIFNGASISRIDASSHSPNNGGSATVPDAPTIGTATAGDASATITFTPPTNNGGASITGYTATSTPGNFTGSSTGSPVTVTGLTNDTSYTFTVHATNSAGNSAESAASNSVTPTAGSGPTVLASDDFNRSNASSLGAATTGQTWSDPGNAWGIVSNKASGSPSGFFTAAWVDAGQTDVTITADFVFNNLDGGLVGRLSDNSNCIFFDISLNSSTQIACNIFARVSGTFHAIATLATVNMTQGTTHTAKLVCSGTTIRGYIDSNQVCSGTDTFGLSGTNAGFSTNGGSQNATFDNFLVTT